MLLSFALTNFGSFRDRTEVSFIATDPPVAKGPQLLRGPDGLTVLPFILFYDPEGCAGSDFIGAMRLMRDRVRAAWRPGGAAEEAPARIGAAPSSDWPTTLECNLIVHRTRYRYGFEVAGDCIRREWLQRITGDRTASLIERAGDGLKFADALSHQEPIVRPLVTSSVLALSAGYHAGGLLKSLSLHVGMPITATAEDGDRDIERMVARRVDKRLSAHLAGLGSGLEGYGAAATTGLPVAADLATAVDEQVAAMLQERPGGSDAASRLVRKTVRTKVRVPVQRSVFFIRKLADGTRTHVSFSDMPEGTRRWLHLLTLSMAAADTGGFMLVDHLEKNLDHQQVTAILDLFSDRRVGHSNERRSQLIATTRDEELIQSPRVRADQVRIVERGREAASISSLAELQQLNEGTSDDGVLQGVHDKVPFAGSSERLFHRVLAWSPPAIHDGLIARNRRGEPYWTWRRKISYWVCVLRKQSGF